MRFLSPSISTKSTNSYLFNNFHTINDLYIASPNLYLDVAAGGIIKFRLDFCMMLWKIGCLMGGSSILFGAFGAHALKSRISDIGKLKAWETAAHYQLLHSVAILAVSSLSGGKY